jgi:hypothetical protein
MAKPILIIRVASEMPEVEKEALREKISKKLESDYLVLVAGGNSEWIQFECVNGGQLTDDIKKAAG